MASSANVLSVTWSGKISGEGRLLSPTLDTKIAVPQEMRGSGKGTHPKELLAASAASCYVMTLAAMMDGRKLPAADIKIQTTLAGREAGGLQLAHEVHIAFTENATNDEVKRAEELLKKADEACMIGNLLRKAEVDVTLRGFVS